MPLVHSRPTMRAVSLTAASFAVLGLVAGCTATTTTSTASSTAASSSSKAPGGGIGGSVDCSAAGTPSAPASGSVPTKDDAAAVGSVVAAANAFIATLSSAEKTSLSQSYTDLETKECSWSNFPDGLFNGRIGLRMGDLTDAQVAAAQAVVKAAMSANGYQYVTDQLEGDNQLSSGDSDTQYGDQNYHIAFYGTPSSDAPWSLQFGGHHLAIMATVGGDALSLTPYFKGSQPVSYESQGTTVRAMGTLSDNFFTIFTSMDATAQAAAKLDGQFSDLVMGPQSDTDYPTAAGTAYGDLTADQKALVKQVIRGYVADYAGALADPLIALYESQLSDTKVSWATSLDANATAYLRIDGPRLWIEWVNTGNPGSTGIHYHTVYRDKQLDYGTGTANP